MELTNMQQALIATKELDESELIHLKTFIEKRLSILNQEKELERIIYRAHKTPLMQGKKQPIIMMSVDGEFHQEFTGFNKCSQYLKNELGIKNEQNKLRKALETGEPLEGYYFELRKRV